VKARLWVDIGTEGEDEREVWKSVIDSGEGTVVRPRLLPFTTGVCVWRSAAGCVSELTVTARCGLVGKEGVGVGESA
jgi:hypothetical protein